MCLKKWKDKQVMLGNERQLRVKTGTFRELQWQIIQCIRGLLLTVLWLIALYKAFLPAWHTFIYVNVFCSSFFSLSLTFLPSHSISCFCIFLHTERAVVALRMHSDVGIYTLLGKKVNLLHLFYYKVKGLLFFKQTHAVLWWQGVRGSSLVCDEVIKNTQSAKQVQACGKHSIIPPLWEVPSSQDLVCTFRGQ